MGTSKEGGGGRSNERVLFIVSEQLTTGWLTTMIVSRSKFTSNEPPLQTRPVQSMGQGHGGWRNSRQTELWESQVPEVDEDEVIAPSKPTQEASESPAPQGDPS